MRIMGDKIDDMMNQDMRNTVARLDRAGSLASESSTDSAAREAAGSVDSFSSEELESVASSKPLSPKAFEVLEYVPGEDPATYLEGVKMQMDKLGPLTEAHYEAIRASDGNFWQQLAKEQPLLSLRELKMAYAEEYQPIVDALKPFTEARKTKAQNAAAGDAISEVKTDVAKELSRMDSPKTLAIAAQNFVAKHPALEGMTISHDEVETLSRAFGKHASLAKLFRGVLEDTMVGTQAMEHILKLNGRQQDRLTGLSSDRRFNLNQALNVLPKPERDAVNLIVAKMPNPLAGV